MYVYAIVIHTVIQSYSKLCIQVVRQIEGPLEGSLHHDHNVVPYVHHQELVHEVVLERHGLAHHLLDLFPNHVPLKVHEGRLRVQEACERLKDVREGGLGYARDMTPDMTMI